MARAASSGGGGAAAAVPSGPGTFAKQTYTVAPAAVPKLGLQGTQCETGRQQGLSKQGHDILDSYTRQVTSARTWREAPAPAGPSGAAAALTQRDHAPHVEFLPPAASPAVRRRAHTAAGRPGPVVDALERGDAAAAVWRSWAPSPRHKPALLRDNAHRPTSPRVHSPGPDVKAAISASAVHPRRRLRPSTANDGRSFAASRSRSSFFRGQPASRSTEMRAPTSPDGVAAWSPPASPIDKGFDDLPQLFIKSVSQDYAGLMRGQPGSASRNSALDDVMPGSPLYEWQNLSLQDKDLLSMYRQMAGSEQAEDTEGRALANTQRSPMASIINLDTGVKLPEAGGGDPVKSPGARGTVPDKKTKGAKESPAGPMAIRSYQAPTSLTESQQLSIETSIPGLDEMKEWRDKQSASRPSSASRPLTVSRPISAKGRPALGLHEALPRQDDDETQDLVLRMMVQGHQMDADRVLHQVTHQAFDSIPDGLETGLDMGIYEDQEDFEWPPPTTSEGTPDAGAKGKPPVNRTEVGQHDYQLEPWSTRADSSAVRVGSSSSSLKSRGGSRPVSASASRPTSASRRGGYLQCPTPPVQTPALIAAEMQQASEQLLQEERTEKERAEHLRHLDQVQQQQSNGHHGDYVQEPQSGSHSLDTGEHADMTAGQHANRSNKRHANANTASDVLESASRSSDDGANEDDGAAHAMAHSTINRVSNGAENHGSNSPMASPEVNMSECHADALPAVAESENSHSLRKGFMTCPSCNGAVPISFERPQQQVVLKYIRDSDQDADSEHVSRAGQPSRGKLQKIPQGESPENRRGQSPDRPTAAVHSRSRPASASAAGELKDLRQQLYDIQQVREREANEREREQNEHRVELSSLKTALDETKAAHKGTQDKLAAAEQKLAATELQLVQAQTHTETDKTTDASHTPPTGVAPAPATKPNSAGSRPASGRPKGSAAKKTDGTKETPGAGTKKENAEGSSKSAAPKVDAVEIQNMMDAIKGLKEKLEAVTTEAASAKDMHDAAIKAKDGELKDLRTAMEKQGQMAQAAQEAELNKVQGELTKAKNEVHALRKQRDAKLAVHERQALKDAQDQLKLDQEHLRSDQEELRIAHEAAQKDIDDGMRVAALRDSLAIKQEELKAFETDLRSQEVQIQSDWQKLHDRQSALAHELEVSVGDVTHDKAVLLKELRLTLTENAELSEKCEALKRELRGNGMDGRESGRKDQGDEEAGGSGSSSMGSRSNSITGAQMPRLPSLNLGEERAGSENGRGGSGGGGGIGGFCDVPGLDRNPNQEPMGKGGESETETAGGDEVQETGTGAEAMEVVEPAAEGGGQQGGAGAGAREDDGCGRGEGAL